MKFACTLVPNLAQFSRSFFLLMFSMRNWRDHLCTLVMPLKFLIAILNHTLKNSLNMQQIYVDTGQLNSRDHLEGELTSTSTEIWLYLKCCCNVFTVKWTVSTSLPVAQLWQLGRYWNSLIGQFLAISPSQTRWGANTEASSNEMSLQCKLNVPGWYMYRIFQLLL